MRLIGHRIEIESWRFENESFQFLYGGQFTSSTQFRRSTTVSLETNPFVFLLIIPMLCHENDY